MTTLLIPTNSVDGTCDSLALVLNEMRQPFFRWNVDLWADYSIDFDDGKFLLTDPVGRSLDIVDSDLYLLWRKPFIEQMTFDKVPLEGNDCDQARVQMASWLHALVAIFRSSGRIRLIEPYGDKRIPKLYQLRIAQLYFKVPRWHFGIANGPKHFGPKLITKPLGDPSVGSTKIFYTKYVDNNALIRPYPWFVQEALVSGSDVTCVHIHGCNYFFECGYVRSEDAIDWRVEINLENQSGWAPLKHPKLSNWQDSVNRYMAHLGLHFGRLDFILQGDTLYFLECNCNGQFGWLDDPASLKLHREFISAALDPDTMIFS